MLLDEIKKVITLADKQELRKFGITLGIISIVISLFLFWKNNSVAEYFLYGGVTILVLGIVFPKILKPIYIVWMGFATIMGFFMTRLILTLLFSIVFTPVGLILRLLKRDPLKQTINQKAKTYWIKRDNNEILPNSAENQF
jgi:hypothetical protein